MINICSSPDDDVFRQEVHAFSATSMPPEMRVPNPPFSSRPSWGGVFKESRIPMLFVTAGTATLRSTNGGA